MKFRWVSTDFSVGTPKLMRVLVAVVNLGETCQPIWAECLDTFRQIPREILFGEIPHRVPIVTNAELARPREPIEFNSPRYIEGILEVQISNYCQDPLVFGERTNDRRCQAVLSVSECKTRLSRSHLNWHLIPGNHLAAWWGSELRKFDTLGLGTCDWEHLQVAAFSRSTNSNPLTLPTNLVALHGQSTSCRKCAKYHLTRWLLDLQACSRMEVKDDPIVKIDCKQSLVKRVRFNCKSIWSLCLHLEVPF